MTVTFVDTRKRPQITRIGRSRLLALAAALLALASGWMSYFSPGRTNPPRDCGPFTIGHSSIGGCDYID